MFNIVVICACPHFQHRHLECLDIVRIASQPLPSCFLLLHWLPVQNKKNLTKCDNAIMSHYWHGPMAIAIAEIRCTKIGGPNLRAHCSEALSPPSIHYFQTQSCQRGSKQVVGGWSWVEQGRVSGERKGQPGQETSLSNTSSSNTLTRAYDLDNAKLY